MDRKIIAKPKRIATLVISCVLLILAIVFAFVSSVILWQLNGMTQNPDQSVGEGLAAGISALILIIFFWGLDALFALVSLILGLISLGSEFRCVRIIAISVCALALLTGVFPLIFSRLIP